MIVSQVRDTRADPVEAEIVQSNPTLNRGRWLVTGEDLDKGVERSFYVESMRLVEPLETVEPRRKRFVVLEQSRIEFDAEDLDSALAFRRGRRAGSIYGRLTDEFGQVSSPVLPRSKPHRAKPLKNRLKN